MLELKTPKKIITLTLKCRYKSWNFFCFNFKRVQSIFKNKLELLFYLNGYNKLEKTDSKMKVHSIMVGNSHDFNYSFKGYLGPVNCLNKFMSSEYIAF